MAGVVCVGIAVMDQVFAVGDLPVRPGKHFATAFTEVGGGPAATAAVTVAKLAGKARFWGRVGNDPTGARILAELSAWGVDTSTVRRVAGGRSSVSAVLVDRRGERTIVAYADPGLDTDPSWLPLGALDERTTGAVLGDVRWPAGTAAALKAARDAGLPAILDADSSPDDQAGRLMGLASHAVFSEPALQATAGTDDLAEGLRRIGRQTGAWVAVTAGGEGCLWLDGDSVRRMPAFAVEAVDTLGAGDVFHGAFALALLEGQSLPAALRFAAAASAVKVTRFGGSATAPTRAEVEAMLAKG